MAEYTGKHIKVLKGLEAVRKRPGMYIGDSGEGGLHHLVYEAIDNSVDEATAGYGNVINFTVSNDNRITIEDFGRGIPIDYNEEEKKSALEIVFTVLHAGGKFDDSSYKTSGGLHGVGASVINALSSEMQVTVVRNKKKYFQEYKKGIPLKDIEEIGKGTKSGTKVSFIPDKEIFKRGIEFKKEVLLKRMKEICFINPFLTINFKFKSDEKLEINYPNGLKDYLLELSPTDNILNDPFIVEEEQLDIALTYKNKGYDTTINSFINGIHTTDGGSHENGALRAITTVMQNKCKEMKITGVKREYVTEGLVLIISTYFPEPNFEGQTKRKLDEPEVEKRVYSILKDKFYKFIEENPKTAKKLIDKIVLAKKTKEAEKRTRETVRKKELNKEIGTLPGKLTDCRSKDPKLSELYLVEGDSAGGCFSPSQRVLLADGRSIMIKDLAKEFNSGKENFVYTFNHKTNKIELQKIRNCWETKNVKRLIKITLDNGEEIQSTIEHRFMLKDGTYLEANKLEEGMSLKPIYLKKLEGFIKFDSEELSQSDRYKYNVAKIEYIDLEEATPVYDIEVPETHNFALSAGVFVHNSAKQGRNKETQAILPLKGKIPNIFKSKEDIIKTNNEISGIIKAIGTGTGKDFDITKIRYHKIITMTDADIDGSHIATLLLFLEFKEFRPIIEAGYFYISIPPLYRAKKGETVHYFADKQERDEFFKKEYVLKKGKEIIKIDNYFEEFFLKQDLNDWMIEKVKTKFKISKDNDRSIILTKKEMDIFFDENKKDDWDISFKQKNDREKWNVTRFKGLGEMNPDQLEETSMNPETRRLVKVTINNVEEADKVLTALGGKDTEFRQWYLMKYVK